MFSHHDLELLNLGPKPVSSNEKPFVEIVHFMQNCAFDLKKKKQIENGEILRQKISSIISKNKNFLIRNNLIFEKIRTKQIFAK